MTVLLRPMELMREIVPQLKSLYEANYAESILKHIIDQNCQGMGKISAVFIIRSLTHPFTTISGFKRTTSCARPAL
jgi:hypothetical protein